MELEHAVYAGRTLLVLSWNSVPGVVFSFAVGRIVGMVFRFAIGTRNQGVWGQRIVEATAEHRSRRGLAGAPPRGLRQIGSAPDHAG